MYKVYLCWIIYHFFASLAFFILALRPVCQNDLYSLVNRLFLIIVVCFLALSLSFSRHLVFLSTSKRKFRFSLVYFVYFVDMLASSFAFAEKCPLILIDTRTHKQTNIHTQSRLLARTVSCRVLCVCVFDWLTKATSLIDKLANSH